MNVIDAEIIHSQLRGVAERVLTFVSRSCGSPTVVEDRDITVGVLDSSARLIAGKVESPFEIAALPFSVQGITDFFDFDVQEGDILISSEPYRGGTQANVLTVVKPIFIQQRLELYVAVRIRLLDLGGAVCGNFHPHATEIWQESVQISPVKLVRRGILQTDIKDKVIANSRVPKAIGRDLKASIEGCNLGERGLTDVVVRYGTAFMKEALEVLNQAISKQVNEDLSDSYGFLEGEGKIHIEDRLGGNESDAIVCIVKWENGILDIDLTESAGAVKGFINCTYANTVGACILPFLVEGDISVPYHQAMIDAFRIRTKKGSLVDAVAPSPVGGGREVTAVSIYTMITRLIRGIVHNNDGFTLQYPPNIVIQEGRSIDHNMTFSRLNVVYTGESATENRDGWGTHSVLAEGLLASVEDLEHKMDIRIESRCLVKAICNGNREGGSGVRTQLVNTGDPVYVSAFVDDHRKVKQIDEGHSGVWIEPSDDGNDCKFIENNAKKLKWESGWRLTIQGGPGSCWKSF